MVRTARPTGSQPDSPSEEAGPNSPAERIVRAVLTCMGRDGIEATGIRDIAREAGVNSAAINYYFRSKENLIRLALERALDTAFDEILTDFERRRAEGSGARAALQRVMEDYVEHLGAYPRLAYAHLRDALVNQQYDGDAVQRFNAFLERLLERLAPEPDSARRQELRLLLTQAWGSLMLMALLPGLFAPFMPLDFSQAEVRSSYVSRLFAPVYAWLDPQ